MLRGCDLRVAIASFCFLLLTTAAGAEIRLPALNDAQLQLTLFAAEPDILTPIGLAIDKRGRLFVVESHTHFPRPDYPGPKRDHVKIFEDTNDDGKVDKISIFADDLYHSMNLAFSPSGQLYLTHRNGVVILHDKDGDGISESRTTILELQTSGNYPHNGIGGIAFSPDGWLYVGLGENLGEKYTLKGSDGRTHSGGGEGGNIFRCKPDGSELRLVATGFWNPFALAIYQGGHLLAVDNDPDSRPPCRLLDVVEQGDYGFKFRFGRSGLHPFVAWNGELPGTLPMMAGTGEAPSGILNCDSARLPSDYRGAVLVTSWGDHFLELYRPRPVGASLRAEREIVAQGDEWFRPVAIAAAPKGAIYFTDWADKDYSVHGKGRIWRLTTKPGVKATIAASATAAAKPNPARARMNRLLHADSLKDYGELLRALSDDDAFIRSAAVSSLARPVFGRKIPGEIENKNPRVRLGALLAMRRAKFDKPIQLLEKLLADPDEEIRRMALVWVGEEKLVRLADRLNAALSAGPVSAVLLETYAAAAGILGTTGHSVAAAEQSAASKSSAIRTLVLIREIKQDDAKAVEILADPSSDQLGQLRIEAARTLVESPGEKADAALLNTALDRKNPVELRAEAVLALSSRSADLLSKLTGLLDDPSEDVPIETARAFRQVASHPAIRDALERRSKSRSSRDQLLAEQLRLALAPQAVTRPSSDDEWRKALAQNGDAARGRRVFFSPAVGCARCHRIEDHGGKIGPDLSTIARAADREKLMQSVLHPSREIAPQFVTHTCETKDGQSYSGLLVGQGADGSVTLTTADGKGVLIPANEMVSNQPSAVSLMPEGLENALTVQDFRDLLAFLLLRN